jgi:pyrroline-5-carboxylate reductase
MNNTLFTVIGGAGKMGTALIDGLLVSRNIEAGQITATARHKSSLDPLSQRRIVTELDNGKAVVSAHVVVLAIGPEDLIQVLSSLKGKLRQDQLLISIVTGVSTAAIEAHIDVAAPVIRANPNIAALVSESATVLCRGSQATDTHLAMAREIFETVGIVEELDERHMNASTGLGGCGPAFVFKIIEAMSEGGVKMGMPREISQKLAAQVLKGAAQLVLSTGRHPAALKDEVTTPGGCTIAGIAKLQERGIAIALIDAVETSSQKAGELFDP